MLIVEEDGYSVMLTGATQKDMDSFTEHLKSKTIFDGVIGISNFKVPKGGNVADVFVLDCLNSKGGREEIVSYWTKMGHAHDTDNIKKLR